MGLVNGSVTVNHRCIVLASVEGAGLVVRGSVDDRLVMDNGFVTVDWVHVMDKSLLVNDRRVVSVNIAVHWSFDGDDRLLMDDSLVLNASFVMDNGCAMDDRCMSSHVEVGLVMHSSLDNRVMMYNLSVVDLGGLTEGWADLAWMSTVVGALNDEIVILGPCHREVQWMVL